jgi:hypothetical protein
MRYARWVVYYVELFIFSHELYMLMWSIVVQNVFELKKNFLVRLLKYSKNEAEEIIPSIVRQYLRSIKV